MKIYDTMIMKHLEDSWASLAAHGEAPNLDTSIAAGSCKGVGQPRSVRSHFVQRMLRGIPWNDFFAPAFCE